MARGDDGPVRSQADRDAVTLDIAGALAFALAMTALGMLVGWLVSIAMGGPVDWDSVVRNATIVGVAVLVGRVIRARRR